MFDSMIRKTRAVATSGLCRGELEPVVAGAGRAMAALGALGFMPACQAYLGLVGFYDGLFHAVSHPLVRLGSCSIR